MFVHYLTPVFKIDLIFTLRGLSLTFADPFPRLIKFGQKFANPLVRVIKVCLTFGISLNYMINVQLKFIRFALSHYVYAQSWSRFYNT